MASRLLRLSALKRQFSTGNSVQHLKDRSLIQVKGPDASNFLQGLITNDINHLCDSTGTMFTMFLNTKGRVLYDSLIYKTDQKDCYWIECDLTATETLQKHLKMYKIRRKVDIVGMDNQVHVCYNNAFTNSDIPPLNGDIDKNIFPETSSSFNNHKDLYIFKDPRVAALGYRILAKNQNVASILNFTPSDRYKQLKYTLGIGEGVEDLSVGVSFPLESNCDYLHGVSFHKGCYIGQELTARTHHTGVTRKRLMPLIFSKTPSKFPDNNTIFHDKVNLGKLRGIEGNLGLALLRINQAMNFGNITVGDGEAQVVKPFWWPIELPKEKLNVNVYFFQTMNEEDIKPEIKEDEKSEEVVEKSVEELKYFECDLCGLREKYEYFGKIPPFQKNFILLEESYVIEDPFMAPKQGQSLVLGSLCVGCNKMICKDSNCSIFYNGTFCIHCAKSRMSSFPNIVQEKLNKIVV